MNLYEGLYESENTKLCGRVGCFGVLKCYVSRYLVKIDGSLNAECPRLLNASVLLNGCFYPDFDVDEHFQYDRSLS